MTPEQQKKFDELTEAEQVIYLKELLGEAVNESLAKNAVITEQAEKLTELQAALAAAGKTAPVVIELPTVEYKGKTYKALKARMTVAGDPTKYSAEQLAEFPEVIEKILSMEGQQLLQELVD